MGDVFRCTKCGKDLDERHFHERPTYGSDRRRRVSYDCRECRRRCRTYPRDYAAEYEQRMAKRFKRPCRWCQRSRKLDPNGNCRACNRTRGLKKCRKCGVVLPILMKFNAKQADCRDCR